MFKLPLIKKQEISLEDVKLIGYDKIGNSGEYGKIVHFFLDDYRFESVYKDPDSKLEKLKHFRAALTPDFSMYTEMPIALQLFSTFKNRWVGAYLQENGVSVIPTVRWGDLASFNFCFDGIEKGSIVAVSTLGVRCEKSYFMPGFDEMRRRIRPSKILCYGEPFDEMKGDIIEVDYAETNNLKDFSGCYVKKCCGYVESVTKGGGSAGGGDMANPCFPKRKEEKKKEIPKKKLEDFPENVQEAYREYQKNGWKGNYKGQSPGTKAGKVYRNSNGNLPQYDKNGNPIDYREYDANSKQAGNGRDSARFIHGSDGRTYYTDDHYDSFTEIK